MPTNKLLRQLQKNQLTKLNLSGKALTLACAQILFEAITHAEKDMNYSPESFNTPLPTVSRKITSDHAATTGSYKFLQPCV